MKRFIKQISIIAAVVIWAGSVSAADDAPGEEDIAVAIGYVGCRHIGQSKELIF